MGASTCLGATRSRCQRLPRAASCGHGEPHENRDPADPYCRAAVDSRYRRSPYGCPDRASGHWLQTQSGCSRCGLQQLLRSVSCQSRAHLQRTVQATLLSLRDCACWPPGGQLPKFSGPSPWQLSLIGFGNSGPLPVKIDRPHRVFKTPSFPTLRMCTLQARKSCRVRDINPT